ncbi:Retrotrans gag domain-containing protein [Abeliophyllum distichum]|uniref:Retrotrans gag domain-containing protein n=1 Tax=Abeliophyllum distichum TaxID=126358 RepID=A0ABD1QHM1_9LAMI
MAQSQSLSNRHSEHREARPEKNKDSRAIDVKPKDEKSKRSYDIENDARELSTRFKMPHMEKYDGKGNPTNHINVYKMRLQGYISTVKCRNFYTTHVFDAIRWYNKLKPGSIKSWPQLK